MAESIDNLRKPGFPKESEDESTLRNTIEYIGDYGDLESAMPDISAVWGDFPGLVTSRELEPTENPNIGELVVIVSKEKNEEPPEFGELRSVSYEIDWVPVERSMYEHPQFAPGTGGASQLDVLDFVEIEKWQSPDNPAHLKDIYKYLRDDAYETELSDNAKLFAKGIMLGQETYTDYAPVARIISEYVGGPPPDSEAGAKTSAPDVPNLPDGYEWRKSADRSTRAGNETRWDRTEEWEGAIKVLSDKLEVFWTV
jgi:hypothetical protein